MIALDIQVSPELFREGLARDLVRHIQQIRKEIDLEIQDHITVAYASDSEEVRQAVAEHSQYICSETLCDDLSAGNADDGKGITIAAQAVSLKVTRV